ncbi:hypothetical protein FEM48_Zijuj02G0124200 [Ziziphus jujuba var. spinosa]|uniref:ABC transporter domain-containing protein n=1 Tax=Ziziphus jujuba var. spinosa TaxID=714518 RepID=A0A978VVQ5_ZIZJJ|nr:hypothetical protein FEM48_Zijuj02G0124200 [Ziziphus jujuba var. spinosa]
MAQMVGTDEIESLRIELAEIGRSLRSSFRRHTPSFRSSASALSSAKDDADVEYALQWAAIERLPTFERIRSSLFDKDDEKGGDDEKVKRVVDVTKLGDEERHLFIEKLIKHIENDNLELLRKIRNRIDRVGMKLPTVEVRYKNLSVKAECEVVHGKPLPTLWNSLKSTLSGFAKVPGSGSRKAKITIINDASGVIKPGRLTLLLGPPGCGKTSLLKALSGNLDKSLKSTGEVSYNGHKLVEFIPQRTSAYISQFDLHISEMTVRETLDFSARCQGVGSRAEIMQEVSKREKEAGIVPDPDIDTYMKVISKKDQAQYWYHTEQHHSYVSTDMFSTKFKASSFGKKLEQELLEPHNKSHSNENALSSRVYTLSKWELLRACTAREILLMRRNSFIYVFKTTQQLLLLFAVHLASLSMFRFLASFFQTMNATMTAGSFGILLVLLFGGFIIIQPSMPIWLKWGFWVSPLSYGEIGLCVNEFLAPRWQKMLSTNISIGQQALESRGLNFDGYLYWISIGALFGMTLVFNIGFILALGFLKAPSASGVIISHEKFSQLEKAEDSEGHALEKEELHPSRTLTELNKGRMVLPFTPLTLVFEDVQYYVDTPLLILLTSGGRMIYSGPLGKHSSEVIGYFEQIPKWWIWLYYLTPTSWSLNGMLTSQYGDIHKNIEIFGETKTVASFLEDYFNFQHDRLPLVALVLIAFPFAFATLFAYFMGRLNFQRR